MADSDIDRGRSNNTWTPECEVIAEGEEDRLGTLFKDCPKNPGHENFIPVSEFKMDHLPPERRKQEIYDYLKARCHLTVRLVVRFTSLDRPPKFSDIDAPYPYTRFKGSHRKVRYGTGSIIHVTPESESLKEGSCPCHDCEKLDEPEKAKEYWKAIVRTATHVIYDDSEASHTTIDCFYDSDENSEETVKHLHGKRVLKYTKRAMDTYLSDMCHLECFTHDRELVRKLEPWLALIQNEFAEPDHKEALGIMISHPHGCSKRITLGSVWHLTYPLLQNYPDLEATKCRLPLFPWSKYSEGHDGDNIIPPFTNSSEKDNDETIDSPSISTSSEKISNQFTLHPGTEFDLPDDMTISFPDNPEFALRYSYHQPNWFNVPPETKFTLADGNNVFFPPEAEFFDNGCVSGCCYVTYDTDTCPGSSGACMIHDLGRHQFRINFPHMGSKNNSENRSGLHYYDLLKRL